VHATVFACSSFADEGRPLDIPELAAQAAQYANELATMTWNDLRELIERGVEVGSHTATHPHLTRLGDAELDAELRTSKERLEEELGRRCAYLAYPFGEDDGRVHAAAARAGYDAAFSLGARRSVSNRYALPRVDLYPNDGPLRSLVKTSPAGAAARVLARGARRGGLRFGAAEGDRGTR
jgi:peptidoglycan/xylan/chitin deacetylase (PgdA/CDA1 family)